MTADRIMQTALWFLRLMTVNMTVSLGLFSAMSALLRGLLTRHGRAPRVTPKVRLPVNGGWIPANGPSRMIRRPDLRLREILSRSRGGLWVGRAFRLSAADYSMRLHVAGQSLISQCYIEGAFGNRQVACHATL